MKANYDFIVVGHGLAGAIITRLLKKRNQSVFVFDRDEPHTSSKIAAGLVNPITGRRFVMSWMFNELNPVARSFYLTWERELGEQILHEMPIIRAMEDSRFIDDVEAKTVDPFYKDFIKSIDVEDTEYFIPADINYQISASYRIDLQRLLRWSREKLEIENEIRFDGFEYDQLTLHDDSIEYHDIKATRIIFCEGAGAQMNPWFNYLPFQPTKGELFELKQEQVLPYAYKRDLILLPTAEDKLWCGALNFWEYQDEKPSDEGELILLQKLRKIYKNPPFIHRHLAAIRPTVRDRRPLIGVHPENSRLSIFNGLGTKGTLLGPYFAQQLVGLLLDDVEVLSGASIQRVKKKN